MLIVLVRILNTESRTYTEKEKTVTRNTESLGTGIPFELSRLALNFFCCARGKQIPSFRCVSSGRLSYLPSASFSVLALGLHFGYLVNVCS